MIQNVKIRLHLIFFDIMNHEYLDAAYDNVFRSVVVVIVVILC